MEEFEEAFAKYCGVKNAIGVANGTDSLILCLRALGVGPGDEVITAPNSWISSASSIALLGARPVFVDVDSDQNINPALIEHAISGRTRCIIPVHLTGRMAKMDEIMEIARRHNIPVLEDAAQAIGAKYAGMKAGGCGLFGSFSLHPLKNLNACGDAGIITTDDDVMAKELRLLRNHGLKTRDEIQCWGFNSRLDTMQAAILNPRLRSLPDVIFRRREIAHRYSAGLPLSVICPQERLNEYHTYHVYVIQCDRRNELQDYLQDAGIETKIHYPIPIHLQPCCVPYGYKRGDFPVAEDQAKRILSLPINQYLTDYQVDFVTMKIREFYGH